MVRNPSVLAATLVCAASAQAAQLVHLYEFKGNTDDSIGSLALTNNGATIGSSSLMFDANQGPTLNLETEPSLAGNYSIGMRLSLNSLDGWRKLVDYKGLTSDMGSYTSTFEGGWKPVPPHLQFVGESGGPLNNFYDGPTVIAAGVTMDVVFTRNGTTGEFAAYLNGSSTPEYAFVDTYGDATATLVGNDLQFRFVTDDTATAGTESSGGILYQVRVWNGALAAADIPNAFASIPEPGALSIALIGLVGLHRRVRRRA